MTDAYSTESGPAEPIDEAAAAEAARQAAARRTGRAQVPATYGGATEPDFSVVRNRATARGIPTITQQQYKDLRPGEQFIAADDPAKEVRTKPFETNVPTDWKNVPEGAPWLDPKGNLHTKPVFETATPSANMLYHMALSEKEKEMALRYVYPNAKVEKDPAGDFYVDDNGRMIKPRGITRAPISALVSGALPMAGAVGGEIVAGPWGAAGGAMAGQELNNAILGYFIGWDHSVWEHVSNTALNGIFGGVGSVLGRLYAQSLGTAGAMIKNGPTAGASRALNAMLGTDHEGFLLGLQVLKEAEKLGLENVRLPSSQMFPGAPQLSNMTEVYLKHLQGYSSAEKTAKDLMEARGRQILTGPREPPGGAPAEGFGIDPATLPTKLVEPKAAVSTQDVGSTLIEKARAKVQVAYDELAQAQAAQRTTAEGRIAGEEAAVAARAERTAQAQTAYDKATTEWLNTQYAAQQALADEAVAASKAGRNSGELWEKITERFRALRQAWGEQASGYYDEWRQLYGQDLASVTGVAQRAQALVKSLPEAFQGLFPNELRSLSKLAGIIDDTTGQYVVEPITEMTLAELQQLRTFLRAKVNWGDFRSDAINGLKKNIADDIDNVLRGVGSPRAKSPATRRLDEIDDWYRETGAIYDDARINTIVKGLKGGEPADPKILLHGLIKEGRSDLNAKIREMVGENLWRGVQAADIDDLFQAARTAIPGNPSLATVDGGRYVGEVLSRYRSGLLEQIHGKETANKFLQQVRDLGMLEPTASIPVDIKASDTLLTALTKWRTAVETIQKEAQENPLGLLRKELAQMLRDQKSATKALRDQSESGPLDFLFNGSVGANEAVAKILGNEDAIFAAERFFGRESPEFRLLQQTHAARILQGTLLPGKEFHALTKEAQEILFPGTTVEQMRMLAQHMDFLMGTRLTRNTATSMAAQSRISHPESTPELGFFTKNLPRTPFFGPYLRSMLGAYYGMWAKLPQQKWLLNFLEKGLKHDDPAIAAAVRDEFRREMAKQRAVMGAYGAGVGESVYQGHMSDE